MKVAAKLGTLAACFFVAPAFAAETVDAGDPAKLVSIIRDLGYRAVLDTDGVGDPMITSSVGGTDFTIFFFGCTNGEGCKTLLFKAGYDLESGTTFDVVEEWNEGTLYGRAYLDDEADPWLEMTVNMFGGVSRENFEDTYDWWEVIVGDFEDRIDF